MYNKVTWEIVSWPASQIWHWWQRYCLTHGLPHPVLFMSLFSPRSRPYTGENWERSFGAYLLQDDGWNFLAYFPRGLKRTKNKQKTINVTNAVSSRLYLSYFLLFSFRFSFLQKQATSCWVKFTKEMLGSCVDTGLPVKFLSAGYVTLDYHEKHPFGQMLWTPHNAYLLFLLLLFRRRPLLHS